LAFSVSAEPPLFDSRRAIHSQKADCGPALWGQAEDFAIAKPMVIVPVVKTGMEQGGELSGFGIY
jgi:hypothetical protein